MIGRATTLLGLQVEGEAPERLVFYVGVFSLLFTFTNVIPLSAVTALTLPLAPWLLYKNRPFSAVLSSLFILLAFIIISTLLYYPRSFLYFDFFRRDGKFFISYAPMIMLGLSRLQFDVDAVVKRFLLIATAVNTCVMGYYLVGGYNLVLREDPLYHSLFWAHNAAGGYLALLSALSLGYLYVTRQPIFAVGLSLNALSLFLTASRGSILGFLGAICMVLLFKNRYTKLFASLMVIGQVLLLLCFASIESSGFDREQANSQPVQVGQVQLQRVGNILDRGLIIWPRAVELFQHSPLIGNGFGSFNDSGVLDSDRFATSSEKVAFNDRHAHNSYLHFMAETGVVGLALLIIFLKQMLHYLMKLAAGPLRYGLLLGFWTLIISAFTEHTLVAPSQVLPFAIIVGMTMAQSQGAQVPGQREV